MWSSVTLKRSLMQISKAKAPPSLWGDLANPYPSCKLTGSHRAFSSSSSSSSRNRERHGITNVATADESSSRERGIHPSGHNGISTTPLEQRVASGARGFGTALDGGLAMNDSDVDGEAASSYFFGEPEAKDPRLPLLHGDEPPSPDDYFGRSNSPAERLASLMERSYYYASYKARGGCHDERNQ